MYNYYAFLKNQKWYALLPLLVFTMAMNASQAATSASFSAQASGQTDSLTLSVTINVADADIAQSGNLYLIYSDNNDWYAHNGTAWVVYTAGVIPVYLNGPLVASTTVELAQNVDFTSVIGAQVYVGYGLTESDMIANEKYSLVYTVTQDAQPSGPPVVDQDGPPVVDQDGPPVVDQDGQPSGSAVVNLGTAGNFAVLAKTAVSTVPQSAITGDVGVSPAATTFLTGFSLTAVGTTSATSTQVTGSLFGADMTTPTNSNLTTAVLNMQAAYTDAAGRPTPDQLNLGSGNIGGLTLPGGLYKWGSSVTIPANLALSGGANDVWIFQISGDLSISANKLITLSGGAQAKNIFWQVAGEVIIGAGASFAGNILSQTAITMQTGSNLNGRALAQSMVALDSATITKPAP